MNRYDILIGKQPPPPKPAKKVPPKEEAKTKEVSEVEKERVIRNLMRTAVGRQRLAASLTQPLRARLAYSSLARRILHVDTLPQGASPIYDKSIERSGYSIRGDEGLVTIPARQNRIEVPIFGIYSNPQISLTQIRERRFGLIDQMQDLALQEIRSREELSAISVINEASEENNIVVPSLTLETLRRAFVQIENKALRPSNIFMNAQEYSILRRICRSPGRLGILDETGINYLELRQIGLLGSIFGATIVVSRGIPRGKIYITAEPQFVGVMPVHTDLTVLSADVPGFFGWSFFEEVGFCCTNPDGVAAITVG